MEADCKVVQFPAERSFVFGGPVRFFLNNFLLSESRAKFLEWLVELAEISWNFPRSIQTLSLTHTCPACFVNPIPHRRHPSAGKVYAADESEVRRK